MTNFRFDNFNKSLEKVDEVENENSEFSISIQQGLKTQVIEDIYQDDVEVVNILGLNSKNQINQN